MQKSADAFRTISEVADDLSLPQHVLRFWETRFPQIRPLKRAGGRRYYRPADVSLLKAIRQLLYDDGYTIKGVQRLLKEQGARALSSSAPQVGVDWNDAADAGPDAEIEAEAGREDQPELHREMVDPIDRHGGAPAIGSLNRSDRRAAIEETLATLEECRRILDALRIPPA